MLSLNNQRVENLKLLLLCYVLYIVHMNVCSVKFQVEVIFMANGFMYNKDMHCSKY